MNLFKFDKFVILEVYLCYIITANIIHIFMLKSLFDFYSLNPVDSNDSMIAAACATKRTLDFSEKDEVYKYNYNTIFYWILLLRINFIFDKK